MAWQTFQQNPPRPGCGCPGPTTRQFQPGTCKQIRTVRPCAPLCCGVSWLKWQIVVAAWDGFVAAALGRWWWRVFRWYSTGLLARAGRGFGLAYPVHSPAFQRIDNARFAVLFIPAPAYVYPAFHHVARHKVVQYVGIVLQKFQAIMLGVLYVHFQDPGNALFKVAVNFRWENVGYFPFNCYLHTVRVGRLFKKVCMCSPVTSARCAISATIS